jgi:hypothetical protein
MSAMHKIKNIACISLCLFLIVSCATSRSKCPLAGKWRPNEKATLEQIEKYGNLTKEQRNAFLNNFSKLTLEYTCSEVTVYYQDSLVVKNMKYEIIKREGNSLDIIYYSNDLLGRVTADRITLVGDCYYLPLGQFTFNEVFCRVK